MKPIKTQQRYRCDFCNKTGIKRVMNKHEIHCVHNPNRICGNCEYFSDILGGIGKYIPLSKEKRDEFIKELKELIPKEKKEWIIPSKEITEKFEEIKNVVRCPSCRLTIVAQSGITPYLEKYYDYKEDFEELNKELQEEWARQEYYANCM